MPEDSPIVPAIILLVGILALVLPYRWNPFRLKATFASRVSDGVNRAVPKVIGWICIVIGVLSLGFLALEHFAM